MANSTPLDESVVHAKNQNLEVTLKALIRHLGREHQQSNLQGFAEALTMFENGEVHGAAKLIDMLGWSRMGSFGEAMDCWDWSPDEQKRRKWLKTKLLYARVRRATGNLRLYLDYRFDKELVPTDESAIEAEVERMLAVERERRERETQKPWWQFWVPTGQMRDSCVWPFVPIAIGVSAMIASAFGLWPALAGLILCIIGMALLRYWWTCILGLMGVSFCLPGLPSVAFES